MKYRSLIGIVFGGAVAVGALAYLSGCCDEYFYGGSGEAELTTQDSGLENVLVNGNGNGLEIGNQEQCEENNGVWKVWGRNPEESCNLRTTDGGTRCYNSSECEGKCFSIEECAGEACQDLVGYCSDFKSVFGCYVMIDDDGNYEICVD